MNQPIEFKEDEAAEFIFERLLARGIVIEREVIKEVLELELQYMREIGIIGPDET